MKNNWHDIQSSEYGMWPYDSTVSYKGHRARDLQNGTASGETPIKTVGGLLFV